MPPPRRSSSQVTRADVAELAGVSPAVVSYVVNDGPRAVSAERRARVEQAIQQLGYRPNALAAALRGGSSRSIGLLSSSPSNPFFAELSQAYTQELTGLGHAVLVGITDENAEREHLYVRSFVDRRVDGIILTSERSLSSAASEILDTRVPVIVIDRVASTSKDFATVHVDNLIAASAVVSHLQSHGHSDIACIAGPNDIPLSQDRIAGWRKQQQAAGVVVDGQAVVRADYSHAGGWQATVALLRSGSSPTPPSALFVSSDVQAMGALAACHHLGLRVPDDVALASIDGTFVHQYTVPKLTSYRQPVDELVRISVQRLLERVNDPELGPTHDILSGHLLIGESCGC